MKALNFDTHKLTAFNASRLFSPFHETLSQTVVELIRDLSSESATWHAELVNNLRARLCCSDTLRLATAIQGDEEVTFKVSSDLDRLTDVVFAALAVMADVDTGGKIGSRVVYPPPTTIGSAVPVVPPALPPKTGYVLGAHSSSFKVNIKNILKKSWRYHILKQKPLFSQVMWDIDSTISSVPVSSIQIIRNNDFV